MDKKFLKLLIIILFILKYLKFIDIEYQYLIIMTLIIIGIISGGSNLEFLNDNDISMMSEIYNNKNGNLKVTKLEVTDKFITPDATINKLNVTDNITSNKTTTKNLIVSDELNCSKNIDINGSVDIKSNLTASSSRIPNLTTPNLIANNATIGDWNIRGQKMGINGIGDFNWEGDWLKILKYDQPQNGEYYKPGLAVWHIVADGTDFGFYGP